MSLAERIREGRKITVTIGDIKFLGIRATSEQFSGYTMNNALDAEVSRRHITGWENVRECDVIDHGSEKVIPFDREVFSEIIGDKPEWYIEIAKTVLTDAFERISRKNDNEKK